MTGRGRRTLIGLIALLLVCAALALVRALVYRHLDGTLSLSWPGETVAKLRGTSIAVAMITGVALAVSGVLLQALLRNPLASPFILGVSSGAALGVMAAMYTATVLGWAITTQVGHTVPALIGSLMVLMIVFALGRRRGWLDPLTLVLTGVVVSAICAALIMFLHHLSPQGLRSDLITWMMGHISQGVTGGTLLITGAITLTCLVISALLGRAMDAATLSADEARSVGVSIGRLRLVMFLVAGALAALSVTLCGPIGFVGLIAPHVARLVIGPRHTTLVFGAALTGAALLLAADIASQVISVGGGRMPVGVFTALIGGPAFIALLRSGKGQV